MLFNMFPWKYFRSRFSLCAKNIGFHFIYSPIGLLIIGIRHRSVSRYPNDVIKTSWTSSENKLKNLIPILVSPVEREMGFSHSCSLERKEDDKLIIILKYFIKAKGWKPIEVTQKGECLYTRLVLLIFCVFCSLSTAAGNSCLLHLPEGFVSLCVESCISFAECCRLTVFWLFQKAAEQIQGRKIH